MANMIFSLTGHSTFEFVADWTLVWWKCLLLVCTLQPYYNGWYIVCFFKLFKELFVRIWNGVPLPQAWYKVNLKINWHGKLIKSVAYSIKDQVWPDGNVLYAYKWVSRNH